MRECPVCGDSDYSEVAGHFYCTTCNTQSQNFRVEEVDTDVMTGWTGHADVIREKKTAEKRKKKVADRGQPWSIYEAYQIILLHQVEALIKLGAREELKDIVFKLWTNYLAHLGVAFSDKGPVKKLQQYERQRELFPGTTKNPKIKNILGRSMRRRTYGLSVKQAEKELEHELVQEALKDEQFEEEENTDQDDDNEDTDSNDENDIDLDDEVIELELLGNRKRRALHSRSVYKMKMIYTVSICYLGLMVTNPLITVVDMIRWMKQNKLPYLNAEQLIGSSMKCYLNDWKLFGLGKVPTIERLRLAIRTLGETLKVSIEAIEVFPFSQLIHKYIVQLDLPAELHRCMAALEPRTSLTYQKRFSILCWEGKAMAHIIVLLKLIFGVNDHSERIFSKYSKELNTELYGGKQQLFVWSKWISHVAEKIDGMDIKTGEGAVDDEAEIAERLGRQQKTNKQVTKSRQNQAKIRDTIQKHFNEFTESVKSSKKGGNSQQASEHQAASDRSDGEDEVDLFSNTLMDDDPVGYLLGRSDNEEEQELPSLAQESRKSAQLKKVEQRGELFRQSSLKHILSPEEFLDTCKSHQISDSVAKCSDSDVVQSLGSQSDWDTSEYDSQTEDSGVSSRGIDKAMYRSVIKQCEHTKKHYMVSVQPRETAQEPAAYNWLIHLFSKFIYTTPSKLQAEVIKVEKQLSR